MRKTFCDACGEEISPKVPNEVSLRAREHLDGGVRGTWEVCDKCFNDIYKKTTFARQFDPNTVEGVLRQIHIDAKALETAYPEESRRILDTYRGHLHSGEKVNG